ncbi:MAG: aminotransferase class I/II-fold pyridoxal phosphate-dependent enzyme, partial [Chitinophagaceae bacterium]|nr:aminotransferase class I/II-fold pyridoxal phosphate-dependent enzyme [Chitinophagaceae bacterium]
KYGDTVAVESPCYFGIYQAIENLGLKVVEISSDPLTGADLPCLEKAIEKFSIKAFVCIPNYNNPVGSCIPDKRKRNWCSLLPGIISR